MIPDVGGGSGGNMPHHPLSLVWPIGTLMGAFCGVSVTGLNGRFLGNCYDGGCFPEGVDAVL